MGFISADIDEHNILTTNRRGKAAHQVRDIDTDAAQAQTNRRILLKAARKECKMAAKAGEIHVLTTQKAGKRHLSGASYRAKKTL